MTSTAAVPSPKRILRFKMGSRPRYSSSNQWPGSADSDQNISHSRFNADAAAAAVAMKPSTTTGTCRVGRHPNGNPVAFELRAFFTDHDGVIREDPVTGTLNASVPMALFNCSGERPLRCKPRNYSGAPRADSLDSGCDRPSLGRRKNRHVIQPVDMCGEVPWPMRLTARCDRHERDDVNAEFRPVQLAEP